MTPLTLCHLLQSTKMRALTSPDVHVHILDVTRCADYRSPSRQSSRAQRPIYVKLVCALEKIANYMTRRDVWGFMGDIWLFDPLWRFYPCWCQLVLWLPRLSEDFDICHALKRIEKDFIYLNIPLIGPPLTYIVPLLGFLDTFTSTLGNALNTLHRCSDGSLNPEYIYKSLRRLVA